MSQLPPGTMRFAGQFVELYLFASSLIETAGTFQHAVDLHAETLQNKLPYFF